MKLTETQVVFYNAEKDGFLEKYKDRGTLAFEAGYTTELRRALVLPFCPYEKQKDEFDKLADTFGCEVLNVEVEYNVTKLDGSDFERPEREGSLKNGIEALMELLTN
jgi:hypothetical protein|nr:MAG TPA: hypothetical protein [Caudoviricetes sp.]